jgi:hypothetical protein
LKFDANNMQFFIVRDHLGNETHRKNLMGVHFRSLIGCKIEPVPSVGPPRPLQHRPFDNLFKVEGAEVPEAAWRARGAADGAAWRWVVTRGGFIFFRP